MGLGQSINTFTPIMPPPIAFGGMYPFGSASGKKESFEDIEEKRKKQEAEKAAEEFMKRLEMIKQQSENVPKIQAQINELQTQKNELDTRIKTAKSGKESEDGTIKQKETWEDYNKLPWWKKGLRAAGAMILDAPFKLAENFIGYETNEKTGEREWNWKKGLRNAAIAAGCIALTAIPVAGPVISTGLLATGVVCGAVGAGKGINKAINAKTPEELDQAYQDISCGVIIGAASAVGLRGLGKGLQTSATTSGAASSVRATGSNAVSQFAKDVTINAYRATVQGIKNDQAAIAANGFTKTFGANLKNLIPKLGKSKYESSRYDTTQEINSRLNDITNELNSPNITPIKKALLEREQSILNMQKTELSSTITKNGWKNLENNSKLHNEVKSLKTAAKDIQTNGTVEINGQTFNVCNENISAIEQAAKRSAELSKRIEQLAKMRSSTIKKMAFYNKYGSEVEAYTGKVRGNKIGRIYDTVKINKSDITWKKAIFSPLKLVWESMMIMFKPWNYLKNSPSTTFYKLEETAAPIYAEGFLTSGFMAEMIGIGDRTMTTKIYTKDESGKDVEEEVAVTKEIIEQMEEQKKQYDEAIAQAQKELSQIFIA